LIIVDEEHENTYKQFDPAPRYHARDTAIYLASLHKAKVLLGSATPSLESFYNAQSGKYGFAELTKRFGGVQLPEVFCADLLDERKKKKMKSHFSSFLLNEMKEALENKEQIILFQNRRGFSPFIECDTCGNVPQCKNCDISLTYHKGFNQLRCHYCGFSIPTPRTCLACDSVEMTLKGFGTEKIEEELSIFFPKQKIARMDLDTTRSKNAYQNIINDFEEKEIDILVGTQMVTKGLDFDNVGLVGVLNADSMLNFPDFRAFERSYQLMAQVSGRAGRKNKRGKVIIQTNAPTHSIILDVISNNYRHMYDNELLERKNFNYPPFYRLIEITLKHKEVQRVNEAGEWLAKALRGKFGKRVLGPVFPPVARVKNRYLKTIMLKIEKEASISTCKDMLNETITDFKIEKIFKSVVLQIDVDTF